MKLLIFLFALIASSCSAIIDPILAENKPKDVFSEVHIMHHNCRIMLYINDRYVEVQSSENLKLDILKVKELKKVYCTIYGEKHAVIVKHNGNKIDFSSLNIIDYDTNR